MKRSLAALAISAFAIVGLTGCGAPAQTTEEACGVLKQSVAEIQKSMGTIDPTDLGSAGDTIKGVVADMRKAGDKVTNEEVKKTFAKTVDAFASFADKITENDMSALGNFTEITEAAQAMEKLCPGISG